MTPFYQKLLDIQQRASWGELSQYSQPQSWTQLLFEERQLLAQLFLERGCLELGPVRRYPQGFRIAEQLFPQTADFFFQEAQLFLTNKSSPYHLIWAEKALARAIQLAPNFVSAWAARAQVLLDLVTEGRSDPSKKLQLAEKSLDRLKKLLPFPNPEETLLLARLAAQTNFCKAKLSGEPKDWQEALFYHQHCETLGHSSPSFLFQFAEVYAHLGGLLKDKRFNQLALAYYDRSLATPFPHLLALLNKAWLLTDLAESDGSVKALQVALDFFTQFSPILQQLQKTKTEEALLLLRWGEMEVALAKKKDVSSLFISGLEKLERSHTMNPEHPKILGTCAEMQLTWGANQGCLLSLRQAKQKAEKLLQLQPGSADSYYLLGCCLLEQARYFEDAHYYEQAIEQFQSGLSIDPKHSILWYVLGAAHLALGEETDNIRLVEKSIRHFAKAEEYQIEAYPELWADSGVALLRLAEHRQDSTLAEMAMGRFLLCIESIPSGSTIDQLTEKSFDECDVFSLHSISHIGCCLDLISRLREDPFLLEKGIHLLEKVLEVAPDLVETRYQLACSWTDLGYAQGSARAFRRAHEHFVELLKNHPENDLFHFDYALSLIGFAQEMSLSHIADLCGETEHHLQAAARLGNQEAYYYLGCLFAFLGQQDRALFALETASHAKALPPVEEILEEEWLVSLQGMPLFIQWLKKVSPRESGSR